MNRSVTYLTSYVTYIYIFIHGTAPRESLNYPGMRNGTTRSSLCSTLMSSMARAAFSIDDLICKGNARVRLDKFCNQMEGGGGKLCRNLSRCRDGDHSSYVKNSGMEYTVPWKLGCNRADEWIFEEADRKSCLKLLNWMKWPNDRVVYIKIDSTKDW